MGKLQILGPSAGEGADEFDAHHAVVEEFQRVGELFAGFEPDGFAGENHGRRIESNILGRGQTEVGASPSLLAETPSDGAQINLFRDVEEKKGADGTAELHRETPLPS